jgi:hypothetical protein
VFVDCSLCINAEGAVEHPRGLEPLDLLEPRPRKAWVDAWKKYACVPLGGYQDQPRFVPLIDVITGVEDVRKAKEFVALWRVVRFEWLERVFITRRPPAFATRDAWKLFASGTFSTLQVQPDDETSLVRVKFAEFLGLDRVLTLPGDSFCFENDNDPAPIDEKITMEMIRETVCELADLNFFFDALEIEQARTGDDPYDILDRMVPMTGDESFTSCPSIPRTSLLDRANWLLAVREFVENWPMLSEFSVRIRNPPTSCSVEVLESAVAQVYCAYVTFLLHRPPVLPRY